MATHVRQYEAMFLLNANHAGGNWEAAKAEVEHILQRANAEIVHLKKWDERRLMFPIGGGKRGVFVLAFFRCDGTRVAGIERDVQIADNILRVLIIKADHLALKDMETMIPQQPIVDEHDHRAMRHQRPGRDRDREVVPATTDIPIAVGTDPEDIK